MVKTIPLPLLHCPISCDISGVKFKRVHAIYNPLKGPKNGGRGGRGEKEKRMQFVDYF